MKALHAVRPSSTYLQAAWAVHCLLHGQTDKLCCEFNILTNGELRYRHGFPNSIWNRMSIGDIAHYSQPSQILRFGAYKSEIAGKFINA